MAQAGAPQYQLFLLGGFECHIGGSLVLDATHGRRKATTLLAWLALQPGKAVHREQAIDALWQHLDPRSGSNNLHQTVYLLRRALGGSTIVDARDGRISLPDGVWVDVDAFRAAAREAIARRDGVACEEALKLYRGPLLPELRYEPWAERPREELETLYRRLLALTAELQAAAGDAWAAEERLRDLIALDPLDEDVHARLIRLMDATGAPRRALAQYRTLEALLRDELDVEPSDDLVALAEGIRARVASGAADPPRAPLDVRYVTSADGTRIAYTVHSGGTGVPLVHMPILPWSNLQIEWNIPEWRAWITRLCTQRPVVRYDLRGLGLSEQDVDDLSVERQVEDMDAVIRDIDVPHVDLFAADAASPIALTYTAHHTGCVRRLALYCAWANGPEYAQIMEKMGLRVLMRADWSTYADMLAREIAGYDEELARSIAMVLKNTTTDMVERYWDAITVADTTPLLSHINAPVLIVRRVGVKIAPWHLSLALATKLPAASVREVGGREYHFIAGDIEPLARAIDEFLAPECIDL